MSREGLSFQCSPTIFIGAGFFPPTRCELSQATTQTTAFLGFRAVPQFPPLARGQGRGPKAEAGAGEARKAGEERARSDLNPTHLGDYQP